MSKVNFGANCRHLFALSMAHSNIPSFKYARARKRPHVSLVPEVVGHIPWRTFWRCKLSTPITCRQKSRNRKADECPLIYDMYEVWCYAVTVFCIACCQEETEYRVYSDKTCFAEKLLQKISSRKIDIMK